MLIILNGSFGIGETTIADLLTRSISGTSIYDPERVGFVLRRLPAWLLCLREQPADYQDLAIWRRLITKGSKDKLRSSSVVIVPMAFTNPVYFNDFVNDLSMEAVVHRLCLVAPLEVVRARLKQRAINEKRSISEFEFRRSKECVEAHCGLDLGIPIDATRTPTEIVGDIRSKLNL